MPPLSIREARPPDLGPLVDVWLRSVRATHPFLTETDIQEMLPQVRAALPDLELWVLAGPDGSAVGFMALAGPRVEALFLAPEVLRRGGGRMLLDHARRLKGPLTVDVNEQNPAAVQFYLACGFEPFGRSPVDGAGRPFPLLHLRETVKHGSGSGSA